MYPRLRVEDVDERAVGEMGVFSWPGLEKRAEDFSKSATSEEMMMVYVKEGTATISDAEESKTVKGGQMVMISDGEVQWSGIGDGGLTLISLTTELSNVVEEEAKPAPSFDPLSFAGGAGPGAGAEAAEPEEVPDLTLAEAVKLLGYGLGAGALAAFGYVLITTA